MIRKAVGTVISSTTVTATTNRTTSRFEARMSRIGPPKIAIPPTSPSVITNSSGTAVKMTFPGRVSRFQDFPTTVTCRRRP